VSDQCDECEECDECTRKDRWIGALEAVLAGMIAMGSSVLEERPVGGDEGLPEFGAESGVVIDGLDD